MKEILLKNGMIAVVDDEDYEKVKNYSWNAYRHNRYYVQSALGVLHKVILPTKSKFCVDHINNNPLDNRRCNLRVVTQSENMMNRWKKAGFDFKGIGEWSTKKGVRYYALIQTKEDGRVQIRGENRAECARLYDGMVIQNHGEYGYLNFPDGYEHILPDHLIEKLQQAKRGIIKRPEDYL